MDNKDETQESLPVEENFENSQDPKEKETIDPEVLKKENKELKDQLMRSLADYQNLSKRVQKERREWILYGAEPALKAVAPAFENFYYALGSEEKSLNLLENSDSEQPKSLIEEKKRALRLFQSIYQNFFNCLTQLGFSEIKPKLGGEFDPSLHEAITSVESEYPPGKICQVYRPGMLLNKRVIKPAQVTLSKDQENEKACQTNN